MPDESSQLLAPSRKGKERQAPQPTDIAEKLYALQRKQAQMSRPKERPERAHPSSSSTSRVAAARSPSPRKLLAPNPNIIVSRSHSPEPDVQDFSRRLKISPASPRAAHSRAQNGSSSHPVAKLYNPNAPEPGRKAVITAEPDAMSDGASSSYAPRAGVPSRTHQPAQSSRAAGGDGHRLFDPRKDNPTKFFPRGGSPNMSSRPTPTPKSSGDYISASSTSSASYAHSFISSNFTLSSTTTDSSASSAIFDHERRSEESSGQTSALSNQLKRVYRSISTLEEKLKSEDWDFDEEVERESGRVGVLVKSKLANGSPVQEVKGSSEEQERERWKKIINRHKELAENMHYMLSLTSAPTLPSSLRNVPIKYNLIIRLWTHAFHKPLESLRKAANPPTSSRVALEHLQDFIYYAYTFYTCLFEERNLSAFRGGWVEALGDLARYRMAVSVMVDNAAAPSPSALPARVTTLSASNLTPRPPTPLGNGSAVSDKAASPTPAPRIDDSQAASQLEAVVPVSNIKQQQAYQPSVGILAARLMELDPEKERWRQIAREWYARGLAATPGAGKLHHHLGLLSRDKDGGEEELRGVYHFVKSLITVHPFTTSRESIQPLWSVAAQKRRQAPEARLSELFVLLHGMLFTNIQLDDFKGILSRFEEKLLIEGEVVEEREWIMMAIVNLGALLEFGKPTAVLRRVSGVGGRDTMPGVPPPSSPANGVAGKVKLMAKRGEGEEKKMDVDDETGRAAASQTSPLLANASTTSSPELPIAFQYAVQLAFSMLAQALRKPTRKTSPFAQHSLNPYIVIMLTFLSTILKDRHALAILERSIPWEALATFFNTMSRRLLQREQDKERSESALLLTSGCAPLPEDWCLRGLGWGGKKVYERGFWGKDVGCGDEKNIEVEVLDRCEANEEMMDGIIEDENEDDPKAQVDPTRQAMQGRWVRAARAALKIGKIVNGLTFVPPVNKDDRGEWRIEGALADKVARWEEEDRREREEEERRLRGTKWGDDDSMDVDDEDVGMDGGSSDDNEDDEDDTDEVKALKARYRYLQSLLQSSPNPWSSPRRQPRGRTSRKAAATRQSLRVVPGYTILIVDTNILLSSLPMFSRLVESQQWTIIVPLPVIMELDGLASNSSPLGEAALSAASSITSHIRSHSNSLKVQTSRGNFLQSLNVRTELVEFNGNEDSWERNMDDLILRAAIWQKDHWADRSAFFKLDSARDTSGAAKVILLSFDRMLRLKARSREVDAADERDLASILAMGT
ncbi:unnamed protein product [Somion occarium]|uniref:PIN domain-containing protein n=1 Tax=Somion occarium TaxID=3059160 RepID=A0ABP1DAF5_9APHY